MVPQSDKITGHTSKLSMMANAAHGLGRVSSVFSVSRALGSTAWKSALLWWSALIIFGSVLVWQLSQIFMSYYSYVVLTVISESSEYPVTYLFPCYSNRGCP